MPAWNLPKCRDSQPLRRSRPNPKTTLQGVWRPAHPVGEARGARPPLPSPMASCSRVHGRSLSSAELFDPGRQRRCGVTLHQCPQPTPRPSQGNLARRAAMSPGLCSDLLRQGAGHGRRGTGRRCRQPSLGFAPPPLASSELYVKPPTIALYRRRSKGLLTDLPLLLQPAVATAASRFGWERPWWRLSMAMFGLGLGGRTVLSRRPH